MGAYTLIANDVYNAADESLPAKALALFTKD
jgi:hypothetical protein